MSRVDRFATAPSPHARAPSSPCERRRMIKTAMKIGAPLLLLVVTAVTAGCDRAVGCDFREAQFTGAEPRCQERSGLQANGFDLVCEGLQADPVEGGCPVEGIVAGCAVEGGGTDVVDWFYPPTTREEVEADCDTEVLEPPEG